MLAVSSDKSLISEAMLVYNNNQSFFPRGEIDYMDQTIPL